MYASAARFYDILHEARGRDAEAEADLVLAELRRRTVSPRSLLDVACGTGAHLPRFADALEVVGLDRSEAMLAVAASRAPDVELVTGDMRDFGLQRRFDAVTCLFSSIGYLVEEAEVHQAIATMASHLEPRGVLLVEGWVEPEHWHDGTVNSDCGRDGDVAVARVVRSARDGLRGELFMRYVAATPEVIETIDEHHVMRLSSSDDFEGALRAAGLSFERLPHMLHPGRPVYVGVNGEG